MEATAILCRHVTGKITITYSYGTCEPPVGSERAHRDEILCVTHLMQSSQLLDGGDS
jgi:hypothetical protein